MTMPGQPAQPGPPAPIPGAMDANGPAFQQATTMGIADIFNPGAMVGRIVQYEAQYEAASGSGKFSIDPAEIQPLIGQWQQAIDMLGEAKRKANALVQVVGPGKEDASSNMANGAKESGKAYLLHNQELIDYCIAEQDKLRAAMNAYQQNEEHNTHHASAQYRR